MISLDLTPRNTRPNHKNCLQAFTSKNDTQNHTDCHSITTVFNKSFGSAEEKGFTELGEAGNTTYFDACLVLFAHLVLRTQKT